MTASFVDSNIWLYALVQKQNENDKGKHELATQIIKPGIYISEQVIAEVTVNLIRKTDTSQQEVSAYLKEFYRLSLQILICTYRHNSYEKNTVLVTGIV